MGIIIAKFRKQKSTYEILEKLENELISIEEFSRTTEDTKKKIVGRFIVIAFLTYSCLLLGLFFYYREISAIQKIIFSVSLVAFPIFIYVIKRFLTWYYSRKIRKNHLKLLKLKEEKKKILEKVEETETYKVAKQILDKFGDTNRKPTIAITDSTPSIWSKTSAVVPNTLKPIIPGLRQRTVGPPTVRGRLSFGSQDANQPTPVIFSNIVRTATPAGSSPRAVAGYSGTPNAVANVQSSSSAMQLPRAILPKNRTVLDKMFDYLVGDGPSNRYALICRKCYNHNGMAFKEEIEYLSFKCCYCGFFNPSRKKRPSGPKFEPKASPSRTMTAHSSDSDVSSVESDEDSSKPIVTETVGNYSDSDKLSDTEVKESVDAVSSEPSNNLTSHTKDSGYSPTEIQDDADSQHSQLEQKNNPFESEMNPFEDYRNSSGNERNPFDDQDIEPAISSTPMDVESCDVADIVPQECDMLKTDETKED